MCLMPKTQTFEDQLSHARLDLMLNLLAVPPEPLTAPRLLAKHSRQLVVSPLVSFSGDGPISSIRLHYRPQDSTMAWSTIVGEWAEPKAAQSCWVVVRGAKGKGTELDLNGVCCTPCSQWTPVRT